MPKDIQNLTFRCTRKQRDIINREAEKLGLTMNGYLCHLLANIEKKSPAAALEKP